MSTFITKLIITSETNAKFTNLDPDTRRKLVNATRFTIPYARHTPAYKLGRWDGTVSYTTIGGSCFVNLLEVLIPIVVQAGYDIVIEDHRKPMNFTFPDVTPEYFVKHTKKYTWPEGHAHAGENILLRDYQVDVINSYLTNPQSLQEVVTGGGKCLSYNTLITINNSNIKIGNFVERLADYKKHYLKYDEELDISNIGVFIDTPSGPQRIKYIIKKLCCGLIITFANGKQLECADKHILVANNADIYAKDLRTSMFIDTKHGPLEIKKIVPNDNFTDFYDIGIDAPHRYYDANGIIHHNTIITAALSHLVEPYGRSIIIVPNKSLVEQTEEDYHNIGLDVGVFFGDRKEYNKTHTIATWQSLSLLSKKSKQLDASFIGDFIKDVIAVIVDEAHSAKADELKNLLTGPMQHIPIRWGLTGTVPKDNYNFYAILASLGPVVNKLTAHELQQQNVLSNCHINVIQTLDYMKFKNYHDEHTYLIENQQRIEWLAENIKHIAQSGNTVVLVERTKTGDMLKDLLEGSVFVQGKTKIKERKEHYSDIQDSNNEILILTMGVGAVGLNLPRVFNLVLVEPGKSFVRVIQSIGRGLRKAKDKDFVNVYDICSNCFFSARQLSERKKFYNDAKYPFTVTKVDYKNLGKRRKK